MSVEDSEVQKIIDDSRLSNTTILNKISAMYMSDGYTVVLRTTTQLQLIKKKEFSLIYGELVY